RSETGCRDRRRRRKAPAKRTARRAQPKGGGPSWSRALPHRLTLSLLVCPASAFSPNRSICQLNLSHPERFNSRAAARLDPAADTNSSIFEGLKRQPGSLEGCHHAPRNSHSKVPCPVPPEIQVSRCPRL